MTTLGQDECGPRVDTHVPVGKAGHEQTEEVSCVTGTIHVMKNNEASIGKSGRWQEGCLTCSIRHDLSEDYHLCRDLNEWMHGLCSRSQGSIFSAEGTPVKRKRS